MKVKIIVVATIAIVAIALVLAFQTLNTMTNPQVSLTITSGWQYGYGHDICVVNDHNFALFNCVFVATLVNGTLVHIPLGIMDVGQAKDVGYPEWFENTNFSAYGFTKP
jgi:hypothetical protein